MPCKENVHVSFVLLRCSNKPFLHSLLYFHSICITVYQGKNVELNKPKRSSGPSKYVVYVKNPKTGNVKKINFGDAKGGLASRINDRDAARNFASRHNCEMKKDKMKAGYWACRLPRYAKSLGLKGGGNYFW